jgi:hypothetical protein
MKTTKDLIGKKTPSLEAISRKHKTPIAFLQKQLAKGIKVEREHTKRDAEAREIALDHLAEIPDYYTRLHKMEKDAKVDEYDDELERLHNATRARILRGAKEGKYWLLRSEDREELIRAIIETTTSASIGTVNMPMAGSEDDPAFGGRNRFRDKQAIKTKRWLRSLRRRDG